MKRTHTKKKWLLPVVAAAAAVAGFFAVCGGNSPVQIARVLSATAQGEGLVSSIVLDTAAAPQEDLPVDAFGERVYPASVTADGQAYHMLAVYADPQSAMDTLLEMPKAGAMLGKISATVGRGGLSAGNWKTYAAAVKPFGVVPDAWGGQSEIETYTTLQGFFDLYENTQQDKDALAYLKAAQHLLDLGLPQVSLAPAAGTLVEA